MKNAILFLPVYTFTTRHEPPDLYIRSRVLILSSFHVQQKRHNILRNLSTEENRFATILGEKKHRIQGKMYVYTVFAPKFFIAIL